MSFKALIEDFFYLDPKGVPVLGNKYYPDEASAKKLGPEGLAAWRQVREAPKGMEKDWYKWRTTWRRVKK